MYFGTLLLSLLFADERTEGIAVMQHQSKGENAAHGGLKANQTLTNRTNSFILMRNYILVE
jgi:hypothetical protein